jgi:RNA polymerase sigma factor (TIGR02999 family)
MEEVTRILAAIDAGDERAADRLLPLVYDELRKLAAAKMGAESPGRTLGATDLVHEAYLRLIGNKRFESKTHFIKAAAVAMRRILVDRARARNASKRGGGRRVDLDEELLSSPVPDEAVCALDESLSQLAAENAKVAELVQLRFFGGLTLEQAAEVLGVSPRTADSWWAYARAWLAVDFKKSN